MKNSRLAPPAKVPTGIAGFDDITRGGLPRGRTTLLMGGPGSGKTIFALQFLAHGARHLGEPGIFVAFEEASKRVEANADGFGWNLAPLRKKKLFFLDARPTPDLVQSGDFDLSGMLAALGAQIGKMHARRIVFDALDVVLALLPDEAAQRREIYRLHEWLLARGLSAIITSKADADDTTSVGQQPFRLMLFMVDCVVMLNHRSVLGVSQRTLRVLKYRGSGFDEDESPFVLGQHGFVVPVAGKPIHAGASVSKERVSSGVARLDTMLGDGYYRGASVLITGSAGTGKTTLSGTFAESACLRGERTLFVSFDSSGPEVIRNLASVAIRLQRYVKSGCLRMLSARTTSGRADTNLEKIKEIAAAHGTRCLVIDPLSTWTRHGHDAIVHSVADSIVDWTKANGITLICTRLVDELPASTGENSPLQISTLVDTWIHLNYLVQGGERNRGLSVIKSRGTAHSNQVRELILSDAGVTLADAYTAGGEVLMGTLRWEKEGARRAANGISRAAVESKRVRLNAEEAELAVRLRSLQVELEAKRVEKALLARTTKSREDEVVRSRSRMRELRGSDSAISGRK